MKGVFLMKVKKMLLIVLALCFAFAVSCGGTPDPAPRPEPTPAPTPAPTPTPTATPAPTPAPQPATDIILDGAETYTVVKGDTLSIIAKRFYQNGYYYPLIALGSREVEDIDLIEPGTRLYIPNVQRNFNDAGARARIKSYFAEVAVINANRNRPHDAEELRRIANSL